MGKFIPTELIVGEPGDWEALNAREKWPPDGAASLGELTASPPRPPAKCKQGYQDTGCHLHPSCLECPRERCIYEEYRHPFRGTTPAQRRKEDQVVALVRQGLSAREIAMKLHLSHRTIFRIKQRRAISLRALLMPD